MACNSLAPGDLWAAGAEELIFLLGNAAKHSDFDGFRASSLRKKLGVTLRKTSPSLSSTIFSLKA